MLFVFIVLAPSSFYYHRYSTPSQLIPPKSHRSDGHAGAIFKTFHSRTLLDVLTDAGPSIK